MRRIIAQERRIVNRFVVCYSIVMSYSINDQCSGCTVCALSCPVEAIVGAAKQQHHILGKRCVSCGVCGRVCPSGAVLNDDNQPCQRVPRKDWQKPQIDTALCSACGMCAAACRAEALRISPPSYRGDFHVFAELYQEKKCVGCALCAKECPLHAIEMREASL